VLFVQFTDPGCPTCESVLDEIVRPLVTEYRGKLGPNEFDASNTAEGRPGWELMQTLEGQFGVGIELFPAIFIGHDVLSGPDAIRERFAELVEYYAGLGGIGWPAPGLP
jgi:hypothetical protein